MPTPIAQNSNGTPNYRQELHHGINQIKTEVNLG